MMTDPLSRGPPRPPSPSPAQLPLSRRPRRSSPTSWPSPPSGPGWGAAGRSVKDYFLGGRSVPWWAIAACIVATETSTLTFIGAPGTAYNGNWTFLQLVVGYVIGRVADRVALFLPAYFRGELYTSYELLQRRFGGAVRSDLRRDLPPATAPWATASACTPPPSCWPSPRACPSEWCILAAGRGHDPLHRGGRRHRHHLDRHHPDVRLPRAAPSSAWSP